MRDWASYLRANLDLPAMRGQRDERAIRELADHLEDVVADALARGGIRVAEAIVYLARLKQAAAGAEGGGDPANPASGLAGAVVPAGDLWERVGDFPLEFSRERTPGLSHPALQLSLLKRCA